MHPSSMTGTSLPQNILPSSAEPAGPCAAQAVIPQAELQELIRAHPAYSYVVDFEGDVVAALVSKPVKVMLCPQPCAEDWSTLLCAHGRCDPQDRWCCAAGSFDISRATQNNHMCLQGEAGAVSLGFVHVGQDLEEQEELLECLLAFFTQYLLADDAITCIKSGRRPAPPACASHVYSGCIGCATTSWSLTGSDPK